jgi:hypothetical protein
MEKTNTGEGKRKPYGANVEQSSPVAGGLLITADFSHFACGGFLVNFKNSGRRCGGI